MSIWDVTYPEFKNLCGETALLILRHRPEEKYEVVEFLPAPGKVIDDGKVYWKWLVEMRRVVADSEAKKVV